MLRGLRCLLGEGECAGGAGGAVDDVPDLNCPGLEVVDGGGVPEVFPVALDGFLFERAEVAVWDGGAVLRHDNEVWGVSFPCLLGV